MKPGFPIKVVGKVYLVMESDESTEPYVIGVYTTLEDADKHVSECKPCRWVDEMDLLQSV